MLEIFSSSLIVNSETAFLCFFESYKCSSSIRAATFT